MLWNFIVTIIVVLCIVNWAIGADSSEELVTVTGPDGRPYKVRANVDAKETVYSAAAIARVNARLSLLIHRLQLDCEPKWKDVVARMAARYNGNVLSEGLVMHDDKTSYTVNKGEQVVFCLRKRDQSNELYSDNKLMHVAVHELAHIASNVTGHEGDFPANLNFLERSANALGLLEPIQGPWEYCGLQVS